MIVEYESPIPIVYHLETALLHGVNLGDGEKAMIVRGFCRENRGLFTWGGSYK